MSNETKKLRKIPIIITKYDDEGLKGYRAELPDNYESYKPTKLEEINFEDLSFHFDLPYDVSCNTKDILLQVYNRKKDAVFAAKYVNENILQGKCKVMSLR